MTTSPSELRAEFVNNIQKRITETKEAQDSGFIYYFREAGMPVNFIGGKPLPCDLAQAKQFKLSVNYHNTKIGRIVARIQPVNGNGEKAELVHFEEARKLELKRLEEVLEWMQRFDQEI